MPFSLARTAIAYVPILLATSPLAATRSQPTATASTSPARSAGPAQVHGRRTRLSDLGDEIIEWPSFTQPENDAECAADADGRCAAYGQTLDRLDNAGGRCELRDLDA